MEGFQTIRQKGPLQGPQDGGQDLEADSKFDAPEMKGVGEFPKGCFLPR